MSILKTAAIVVGVVVAVRVASNLIYAAAEKSKKNNRGDEFDRAVHRANEAMFEQANQAHQRHARNNR